MGILSVLEFPDPRLRTVAKTVEIVDEKIKTIVNDMYETMYETHGVGLAATQVNIHQRIVVIDVSEDRENPYVLINPEIILKSDETLINEEGCLSVPGYYADVERFTHVTVEALDRNGKALTITSDEFLAIVMQHEIDHLNGTLFIDYLSTLKKQMALKKVKKLIKNG